ncbi:MULTISPECIES: zinc-binding dehydrogenase [Pseudoalteromonas]|uniref:Acetoin dehydrogenase n=1 Tax=Pseudoalteromonas amylolytica TaxID=1859457 RepID=A0A1S1MQY0_9GAMM|nr:MULTISPECIES: zinc-binding dehydrogenase [Pseudoalteromonas]OHU87557.1 acetoin dehydrogenase [Pseudoalteromonas sp. JW3]OHU91000.1 acetoin dehydrogenase [Pseudoalteromonas amylolytica]
MKAAVLFKTGELLTLVDNLVAPELISGQVKVDIIYTGLCHSQLMEVKGLRGEDKYLPHLLGHEAVAKVKEIGPQVTKVQVGDIVVLGWIKGEGLDAPGGIYSYQGTKINAGGVTTFSQESIVSENRVVKLPAGIPYKLAILLGCALPTGAGLVLNQLKPQHNAKIAVFGLGGIGLSALITARLFKPNMLIAVDIEPKKLELAGALGATHCINAQDENYLEQIVELTQGGCDYTIEAGGTCSSIEDAFTAVKEHGGQCIFASHPEEGATIQLEPHAFHRGKQIMGSWGGSSHPDTDIPKLVELYNEHKLPFEKLLSDSYSLDEINQALQDLDERKITRALIAVNPQLDPDNG